MATTDTGPEVSEVLARLDARMQRLEAGLDRIAAQLDALPDAFAMAADAADAWAAGVAARGPDVDSRARALGEVAERVSRPPTAEALARLVDRAEAVEGQLAAVPGTVAMVADIVDAELARLTASGHDVDAMVRGLAELAVSMSDPDVLALVRKALGHADVLGQAVDLIASSPDTAALVMDSVDDFFVAAVNQGVDMGIAWPRLTELAAALSRILTAPEFGTILDSGLIDRPVLRHLSAVADGWRAAHDRDVAPAGPFRILGALSDPDTQRFWGLLLAFGRGVGASLRAQEGTTARLAVSGAAHPGGSHG